MANLFSLYATTLLLLSTSSALMAMVGGDKCKEELGACSNDCNKKCLIAHQDSIINRICDSAFPAGEVCNDQYCGGKCAAKHPGVATEGFCYDPGLGGYCVCRYRC